MPQAFVDFHERITGHQGIASVEGSMAKDASRESPPRTFFVDEGSESASFSVLWDNKDANARVQLVDPNGTQHQMRPIPQGLYARIKNPVSGDWKMQISSTGADARFIARGYVHNRVNNLVVSTRWPTRKPGSEMYVYAFPKSKGGAVTEPGAKLTARVTRPDGSSDTVELFDGGRDAPDHGDDLAGDGVFTGVYKNTNLKGAYAFQVSAAIDKWHLSNDPHRRDENQVSPRFMREVRLSSSSGEAGDVPKVPEDDRPPQGGGGRGDITGPGGPSGTGGVHWKDYCCWLFIITLILLIIALILLWRCYRSKRTHG
jgi:hypothetical protein